MYCKIDLELVRNHFKKVVDGNAPEVTPNEVVQALIRYSDEVNSEVQRLDRSQQVELFPGALMRVRRG
jgi:hypothetical protein